jgi:hypothetical protein
MSDLSKGMIRWFETAVMDYDGIKVKSKGFTEPHPKYGKEMSVVERYRLHDEWRKSEIFEGFTDKPINDIFNATMTLDGFYRGRSAAGFLFKDHDGRKHTMRIKCVELLLKSCVIDHGKITGRWTYVKQGSNFSLKYVGTLE